MHALDVISPKASVKAPLRDLLEERALGPLAVYAAGQSLTTVSHAGLDSSQLFSVREAFARHVRASLHVK